MHPNRHIGVGTGEIIGFLSLLAVGIVVALYLNQKPTVVVKTVVVQPDVPAPVAPEAPAPPATETVVVKTPPPAEVSLPTTTIIVAPAVPPCVAIERNLRIAQEAAAQTMASIAAAKRQALRDLYQSPDYVSAKSDEAGKKSAKQTVADNLQKDRTAGADTDHDIADMQATSAAWVASAGAMAKMEDDAIASNDAVNQQLQNLKDIKAQIAGFQKQLGAYISTEIKSVCRGSDCQINNVSFDAKDWTIYVELTPAPRPGANEMADVAVHNIGTILETLTRTPFTWNTAQFKVYDTLDSTRQSQFQMTYQHSDIAGKQFEVVHINNLLFQPLSCAFLEVGQTGMLIDVQIYQIIDDSNLLVIPPDDDKLLWLTGVDTAGKVDGSVVDVELPMRVVGTKQYTALGTLHTVFLLAPSSFHQSVMPGDYFDNKKLIDLASKLWLNPHIDQLQGRPALPDSIVARPGAQLPELFNTLAIGGYTRADGSVCPPTFVHTSHAVKFAQADSPANKTPHLPFPAMNNNAQNPGFGF